jgi:hypothetical protein
MRKIPLLGASITHFPQRSMQQPSFSPSGSSGTSIQDLMHELGSFIETMRGMSEHAISTLAKHSELENSLNSALLSQLASGASDSGLSLTTAQPGAASEAEIAHQKVKADWQELTDQGDAAIVAKSYKNGRKPSKVPDSISCGMVLVGLLNHQSAYLKKGKTLPSDLNIEGLEPLASVCLERNRFLTERGFELVCEDLLACQGEKAPAANAFSGYDALLQRMQNTQDLMETLSAIRAARIKNLTGKDTVD